MALVIQTMVFTGVVEYVGENLFSTLQICVDFPALDWKEKEREREREREREKKYYLFL